MDKIIMKGMEFFGYHGVNEEEKREGQTFIIDACLYLDLRPASGSDRLEETVNYSAVYDTIKDVVENRRFDLIETLSKEISLEILSNYALVQGVKVRVKKPQAPVKGKFEYMAVEVERFRDE